MDQITHDVRGSQWLEIITQCQNRPEGTTAKQWMADNGINEKSYYYWLRKFRKLFFEVILTFGVEHNRCFSKEFFLPVAEPVRLDIIFGCEGIEIFLSLKQLDYKV